MLVDLETLRPKNETYEHFLLKQVGRAFLFSKGLRYIAHEVHLQGQDASPYGYKKIVDVVGIERKRTHQPSMRKMYEKVHGLAVELGKPLGLTVDSWGDKQDFINIFRLRGEEKISKKILIEKCYEDACLSFGLHKDAYKRLSNPYKEEFLLVTIESKWSYEDFKNGFSTTGDHAYIISPKGVIPLEEIPNKMGLLEFDFNKFYETKEWTKALTVKKKPKKQYDSMFLNNLDDPKSVDLEEHERFCRELVFSIAQESTEETVFWNPFLRHIPDGESHDAKLSYRFKFKAGDETPLGIVIDRRIGKKTPEDVEAEKHIFYGGSSYTQFYKLVVPGKGITNWISQRVIENSMKNKENN